MVMGFGKGGTSGEEPAKSTGCADDGESCGIPEHRTESGRGVLRRYGGSIGGRGRCCN